MLAPHGRAGKGPGVRRFSSIYMLALPILATACVGVEPELTTPSRPNDPVGSSNGNSSNGNAENGDADGGTTLTNTESGNGDAQVPRWTVPADAPPSTSYTISNTPDGALVTDSLTGLTWQDNAEPTSQPWNDANAYCNDLAYGGSSEWRLPTRMEAISVLTFDPTMSKAPTFAPVFSSVSGPNCFWTSTAHLYSPTGHWVVDVLVGAVEDASTTKCAARCVRGAIATPVGARYERIGTDFVRDRSTGLLWERAKAGRTSWATADRRCKDIVVDGHAMRLPGIKELASIVDDTRSSPASFAEFDTASENMFTANTYWFLNFAFGEVKQTSGDARSRCVLGP